MLALCRRWLSGDQLRQASSPGAGAWLSHLLIRQGAAGQCLFHISIWWCCSPFPQLKEYLHSWGAFPWLVCLRLTALHFVPTWRSEWKLVMQWIKSLVAVSTEIFNRDVALQRIDYFSAEFYSCKCFAGTVGRREWGGNVFPQELCRESLNCSPESRRCRQEEFREGAKQTLLLLLHVMLSDWAWPRSHLIGLF